ncbi:MAG: DedA family protein [Acidimicrobiales bacterium]|jgi:membrane protein DedA with SNARE-associated domain
MNIDHLVASYGYLAVFVFVAIESLGVPLPGETALIAAGGFAGHTHQLSPWLIWAVASAATIAGGSIGYWIGEKGGYRLVRRYGSKVRLDAGKLKVGRYIFDRHGGKVVFFGRFVAVLRTYASFLAGTNRMEWRRYFLFNAASGVVWSAIYTLASYAAASTLRHVSGTVNLVVLGIAGAVVIVTFLLVRRKTNQLVEIAEALYPGPLEG